MPLTKVAPEETESRIPEEAGRMWFLKDALETDHVAFTVLELEPREEGLDHDHESQEEVYYVEEGGVDLDVGDRTVGLEAGDVVRIDPEETRQVHNRDSFSRLVMVGAPRDAE